MAATYEMSKTYQYRKVMKPLLERKRRARINKCLDDLKDLMAERIQLESGDPSVKLEKADILELTVNHLQHMKMQRKQHTEPMAAKKSFRSGYIHAANEVSHCLATLPNVDIALGTRLMTHLGLRLNQLEAVECAQPATAINTPLNINCVTATLHNKLTAKHQQTQSMYSPISSGYESDGDSMHSGSNMDSPIAATQGLLQMATQVWRPW